MKTKLKLHNGWQDPEPELQQYCQIESDFRFTCQDHVILNKKIADSPGLMKEAHVSRDAEMLMKGLPLRCGWCENCLRKASMTESTRLRAEYIASGGVCLFVTLTYADTDKKGVPANLYKYDMYDSKEDNPRWRQYKATNEVYTPPSLRVEHGGLSLNREDSKRFVQRLQYRLKKYYGKKYRIFVAGEYGSINERPHFHVLIFGLQYDTVVHRIIQQCWVRKGKLPQGTQLPKGYEKLPGTVHLGEVQVDIANKGAADYIANYAGKTRKSDKNQNGKKWLAGRDPEFGSGSQKPAMGWPYVERLIQVNKKVGVNRVGIIDVYRDDPQAPKDRYIFGKLLDTLGVSEEQRRLFAADWMLSRTAYYAEKFGWKIRHAIKKDNKITARIEIAKKEFYEDMRQSKKL